jgi:hypothetical protein
VDRLKPSLRACLAGSASFQEVVLDATNRRGRAIACKVTCTPMSDDSAVTGVILVMEGDARLPEERDETRPTASGGDGEPAGDAHL